MQTRPFFLQATLACSLALPASLFAQPSPPASTPPAADTATANPPPPGAPGGPGGFGAPGGRGPGGAPIAEVKLRDKFDKDGNKLLDATERKAALEYIAANPIPRRGPGGRGGRGFGGGGNQPSPGEKITPGDVKTYGSEPLYDTGTLRTLFFTFDSPEWEKELETFHNTDIEVPATLQVDGKTYRDVGTHFRGASSYFTVSAGSKRSLNVTVDFAHKDQNLLGHHSLNLLNAHGDASYLRPVLYSHIAQQYIPAPRANFVRVVINGENWGTYVSQEQFNRDFLQAFYKTSDGVRWKAPGSPAGRASLAYLGDDPSAYRNAYELKSKDDPKAWTALIRLCRVLNETPPDKLEAALAPLLDIDGALKFLALENVMVNADGYWTRTSDYNLYQDTKGRFHVLPHDMNETFSLGGGGRGGRGPGGPGGPGGGFGGQGQRGGQPGGAPPANAPVAGTDGAPPAPPQGGFGPGGPGGGVGPGFPGGPGVGRGPGGGGVRLDPLVAANNANMPLISKLLAVPALRERYMGYVRDIATTWLDWSKLGPIAQRYHDLIDADVKRDTRKLDSYEDFASSLTSETNSLKKFADERRAFLLRQP